MIQHTLYIGLNDKDTKQQEVTKEYVIDRLDYYFDAYTLIEANGRYKYNNDFIQNEVTLIVIVCEYDDVDIKTIANQLKVDINQECIMIVAQELDVHFI